MINLPSSQEILEYCERKKLASEKFKFEFTRHTEATEIYCHAEIETYDDVIKFIKREKEI